MQLNVPPDLETLINKRLSSGGYTNAEDVLRRALEAQDAEESWTDEERKFNYATCIRSFEVCVLTRTRCARQVHRCGMVLQPNQ